MSFYVLLLMFSGGHFVFVIWFVSLLCLFCLVFGATTSCLLWFDTLVDLCCLVVICRLLICL